MVCGRGVGGRKFSYAELEQLWISAGGNPSKAPIMAAIATAESSGWSINDGDCGYGAPGATSFGLWQVHIPAHREYTQSFLDNPQNNAKAAVAVSSNGTNLVPWTTYNNGTYKQYLNPAVKPSGPIAGTLAGSTAPRTGGATGNIGGTGSTSTNAQGGTTPPAPVAPAKDPCCLIGFGLSSLTFGVSGDQICLLSRSNAQAIKGGLLIAIGTIMTLTGATLAFVAGTGIGKKATGIIPGGNVVIRQMGAAKEREARASAQVSRQTHERAIESERTTRARERQAHESRLAGK